MSGLVFVDTNVLLYALDAADPNKQERAQVWREWLWETRRGRLSFQVLQEFYSNVCRKWPRAKEATRAEIGDLLRWKPVSANELHLRSAWQIQDRFGVSFWDSLIIASAKASLCEFLLSEDFQAGQNIDGLLIVNPFHLYPTQI
ncbi:MAG TPA: PIN domain-containing protein [Candidatus Acidoferrum sp.]|nr:PIN domain-containing protein [Candidatus Acidoferrum sp.]